MNYKKATIWVIIISSALRIIIANTIYLGVDEVYYRQFANTLQINYLDHPPMVAWLIRLTTINLQYNTDVAIRLGAIQCAAAATWVVYCCGKLLHSHKAGYYAAILYSTNLYTSIIAGTFILPDSPQVLFYTLGLYLALHIVSTKQITIPKVMWLYAFSTMVGLAFMCKIHAVFLWFGFLLYCILYNRHWCKHKVFYFSILLSCAFAIPLLYWNIQHNFITFTYHSSRVNVLNSPINFTTFFQFNIGQIAYSNIIFLGLFIIAIRAYCQQKIIINKLQYKLLICCILPIVVVASIISLFKQVLPHWTGQAFIPMMLLTAVWLAQLPNISTKALLPNSIKLAILLYVLIISISLVGIKYLPTTLGKKNNANRGSNDFTADLIGWSGMKNQMQKVTTRVNDSTAILICNGWFPAAHVEHYIAEPLHMPIIALGSIDKIHQYYWWNNKVNYTNKPINAFIVKPSNYTYAINEFAFLQNKLPTSIDTLYNIRNNYLVNYFVIYYYKNVVIAK